MGSLPNLPNLPSESGSEQSAAAAEVAMSWRTEALWQQLKALLPGLSIEVVERTDSTNSQLLARARARPEPTAESEAALVHRSLESRAFGRRADDNAPCLLVAEQQTLGRGRQGRSWLSARGASLTFSLGLPYAPADWSGLSLAVGLALADALDPPASRSIGQPARIGLKWPNDLWLLDDPHDPRHEHGLPGRKLGGILIETVGGSAPAKGGSHRRQTVIGVGINIAPVVSPDQQAQWLENSACLHEIMPTATPPDVLLQIAQPLVMALLAFEREGFGPLMARYAARDLLDGNAVRTTSADAPTGRACGVSASGALRVDVGDRVLELTSGDVTVRLQDSPQTAPAPLDALGPPGPPEPPKDHTLPGPQTVPPVG
jgi:BirA family transcriptional regulator, biotin operon repressor / biotin---[acetyl-CoA-carboxylase] ligase